MAVAMATMGQPDCCADAVRRTHLRHRDRLTGLAEDLLAQLPCGTGAAQARSALVSFVRDQIIPQAAAEEAVALAADASVVPVARALPGPHRMLGVLADEIASDPGGVATAAVVGALVLLCDARWDGEDKALLPALTAAGVDLEALAGAAGRVTPPRR